MTSPFIEFRASIGRDGPEYSIVEKAVGEDRCELESDLIANLEYYDVLALGLLKSTAAAPHLKRRLTHGSRQLRSACGRALWDIEQNAKYLKPIIDVILDRDTTDKSERISAIGLLTNVTHPNAFDALEASLFDPEYLVRSNAASTFTYNAVGRVDQRTVSRNTFVFDQRKLERYAKRLRAKLRT